MLSEAVVMSHGGGIMVVMRCYELRLFILCCGQPR